MKIKAGLIVVVVVWFLVGGSCWAKDLGTITLKPQSGAKIISSITPSLSPAPNNTSKIDSRLASFIGSWKDMAQKVSDKIGIGWNSKLGFILSRSKVKQFGIKVAENSFKVSISKTEDAMLVTGFKPDKGLYAGYEKNF